MIARVWDYVSSRGLEDLIYKMISVIAFFAIGTSEQLNELPSVVISHWSSSVFGSGELVQAVFSWLHNIMGQGLELVDSCLIIVAVMVSSRRGVGFNMGSDRTGATIILAAFFDSEFSGGGIPVFSSSVILVSGIASSVIPRIWRHVFSSQALVIYQDRGWSPFLEIFATVFTVPLSMLSWMLGESSRPNGRQRGTRRDPIYFRNVDDDSS